jgi:hypothetical protein
MSKILRFVFLVTALSLMLALVPSSPAHASFSAVCYITSSSLPVIRMQSDADGGVTFYVQSANGDGRFLQIRPGGGHWEIHTMNNLPTSTALELDSSGYPVLIQD